MPTQECQVKTKTITPLHWVLTYYISGHNCRIKFRTKQDALKYMIDHAIEGDIEPSANVWYLSGIGGDSW